MGTILDSNWLKTALVIASGVYYDPTTPEGPIGAETTEDTYYRIYAPHNAGFPVNLFSCGGSVRRMEGSWSGSTFMVPRTQLSGDPPAWSRMRAPLPWIVMEAA